MDKKISGVSQLMSRFRGWIQAGAALLTNLHLPNFIKGGLYQGKGKTVCVPGLNCYSCPAASGACPIGAFQAVAGSSRFRFSYYVTGFLILLGVLLGRFICGFLCPFGWFQELLHKIPTKKLSTKKLKPLTYLKYVVLLVMVVLLPALVVNDVGMGNPFFCKYLCPQGVLEGAIPLSIANSGIRAALGSLFTWKFTILMGILVLSVLFYRPFCKWLCPLGAFYALMNRVSLFQMKVDKSKCVSCGKCARACKMDVDVTKTPNHGECIRCGMCVHACPTGAVCFRYGFGDGEKTTKKSKYGGIKMNKKKWIKLGLTVLLAFSLTACGTKNSGNADQSNSAVTMTAEAENAQEALSTYKKLMEQENEILSENTDLWEKVYMEADKGSAMLENGKNYGDFLLDTIENVKDQFSDEEYELLKTSAEKISEIENKLTELEQKYPEIVEQSMDSETSVPGDSAQAGSSEDSSVAKFPAFEGKDLDGNPVKSDELFSGNAVTVVNFWFTTCNPCVGELGELDALNKELAEKNGALIGVNSFTLDGNEAEISEAKDVLAKKGATYQNVYFDSDSEAGRFTTGIYAYPTTYVVDRKGNIVGDPIVGAITEKNQAETLQKLIDQAIASDTGENEE